jgi:hypothetical protein
MQQILKLDTALYEAAAFCREEVVQLLLEKGKGADANTKNVERKNILVERGNERSKFQWIRFMNVTKALARAIQSKRRKRWHHRVLRSHKKGKEGLHDSSSR